MQGTKTAQTQVLELKTQPSLWFTNVFQILLNLP